MPRSKYFNRRSARAASAPLRVARCISVIRQRWRRCLIEQHSGLLFWSRLPRLRRFRSQDCPAVGGDLRQILFQQREQIESFDLQPRSQRALLLAEGYFQTLSKVGADLLPDLRLLLAQFDAGEFFGMLDGLRLGLLPGGDHAIGQLIQGGHLLA